MTGAADDAMAEQAVTLTLQRGLEVLRAFRADRAPLSNIELVRRTGYSKAVVSRLTSTLLQLGFLRRAAGGQLFELGSGALGIGHAFLEGSPVRRLARPLMQRLADELDVSVALGVGDHLDMLYVAYCTGERIATLRLGEGSVLPMSFTSIGRAWLHALPPAERDTHVGMLLAAAGTQAGILRESIASAFEDIDASGACVCIGEFQRDAYGISTPLHAGRHRLPMALSCGAVGLRPSLAAVRKRVVPRLRQAARELEALLAGLDDCH
ncbi:IclR family transcriptional regulator [Cupriavidus sp. 30B13]|uniref:IclR family transcriptional regulator n=1 Tax=Cupriavidus sp. 30B13 TaxID=3384241 RepID=UPI003B904B3D